MVTKNSEFLQEEPTTIAPVIYKTMELVAISKAFTILFVLTDGDLGQISRDSQAVIDASRFPISICAIGIGSSEYQLLEFFDNNLFERIFDNFNFTSFKYYVEGLEQVEQAE